jgi:hypothetical protein
MFFVAIIVATIAGYYSVIGLTSIFTGAFWSIVVMASSLETAKVVCTSWLQRNWNIASATIKYYLTVAIIVLSLITSLGIFGFLSKSHISMTTSINVSSLEIQTIEKQEHIVKARLDYLLKKAGDDPQKISKATDVLIQKTQKELVELNEKKLPLLQENSRIEAEVGPLKYVAEIIYSNVDRTAIESAVRLLIILIVLVFDPLAIVMIMAANQGFMSSSRNSMIKVNADDTSWVDQIKSKKVFIDKNKIHTIRGEL